MLSVNQMMTLPLLNFAFAMLVKLMGFCIFLLNAVLSNEKEITIKIPSTPKGTFLKGMCSLSHYVARFLLLRKRTWDTHSQAHGL
jgi:hypothetical protein